MSTPALKIQPRSDGEQLLQEAFDRFTMASTKLEERYQLLHEETEILRRKLEEKEQEIKRTERLATLGQTAAAIAHEVRNPLGAIKLFLSLLRGDVEDRPQAVELVEQIDTSISTLDSLVSNILTFSHDRTLSLGPVSITALIEDQASHFRKMCKGSGAIVLSLEASPFTMGNEQALRQVMYNLMLNALQATRFSGKVTIATRDRGENAIEITIADNGAGIDPSVLERVFEPFVTTKNEGTGLGLAIVRRIVQQHGGEISVRNQDGAMFIITLPRSGRAGE